MYRYIIVFFLLLSACSPNKPKSPISLSGEAQGTYYSIIYYDSANRNFQTEIDSMLDAFDQSVSLWVPQSILSRVNNNDKDVVIDKYFIDNFNLSTKVAIETNGAFDFTIGPIAKAWGFGSTKRIDVDSATIDSLLKFVGYDKVKIVNNHVVKQYTNTTFDFNGIAQGYSVDMVGNYLISKNIHNFLIDIGGEVTASGIKPDGKFWKVGIEKPAKDPNDERKLTAIIKLENLSVATSGNYRKFFIKNGIRYSHTINPETGYPIQRNLLSASIVSKNTALADAYATACMVMGLKKSIAIIENNDNLEAFFIYSDNNGNYDVYATAGFNKLITGEFK